MAATPDDDDKAGIEILCKQLLKHIDIDLQELAGLLVEQNYVTTVMKVCMWVAIIIQKLRLDFSVFYNGYSL